MIKHRITIKYNDGDVEKTAYVKRPTAKDYREAQGLANKAFKHALDDGAILRTELDKYMRDRGLWDSDKQKQLQKLDNDIEKYLLKLKKGGIKLSRARDLALKIRQLRFERTLLLVERNRLDDFTVESQSENVRFDYLVSACTVDENDKPIFKDLDDYQERANEVLAVRAAAAMSNLIYGLDENWEARLPENQFLLKYKFVDDKLRLIDENNNLIDDKGNRINENLQRIDKDGNIVDENGNPIDEDGLPIIKSSPFLDDDNNPIE